MRRTDSNMGAQSAVDTATHDCLGFFCHLQHRAVMHVKRLRHRSARSSLLCSHTYGRTARRGTEQVAKRSQQYSCTCLLTVPVLIHPEAVAQNGDCSQVRFVGPHNLAAPHRGEQNCGTQGPLLLQTIPEQPKAGKPCTPQKPPQELMHIHTVRKGAWRGEETAGSRPVPSSSLFPLYSVPSLRTREKDCSGYPAVASDASGQ